MKTLTRPDSQSENAKPPSDSRAQSEKAKPPSKLSPSYWTARVFRPLYHDAAGARRELGEFYAQVQHAGRREKVSLAANSREEAGRRAARFYAAVRAKGWEAALRELSPDRAAPPLIALTVGDFLQSARPLLAALDTPLRDRTFANYAYALRKIAAEVLGDRRSDMKRFDPVHCPWRKEADRIFLAKLTPPKVEKWKAAFIAKAGGDKLAEQRARRSVNSFVRNARSLFSRKALEAYRKAALTLPTPLPFDGVQVESKRKLGSLRYVSTVNAAKLLQAARDELRDADPDAYTVVLLALGAGLRRSEIDNLQVQHVDFDKSEIRVTATADFLPKTADSDAPVYVDTGLLTELKALRGASVGSLYLVESATPRAQTHAAQYYRCAATFRRVTKWLHAQGVLSARPLHAMRKEFGSLVCAQSDIYTASRQLRHADLQTTAAYYTDHRRRSTVEVGAMLAPNPEPKNATAIQA